MSAELWSKLKQAVTSIRPDLAKEFEACRNRSSIVAFMNKNFPLTESMTIHTDWTDHMSVKIPDMLKEHFNT